MAAGYLAFSGRGFISAYLRKHVGFSLLFTLYINRIVVKEAPGRIPVHLDIFSLSLWWKECWGTDLSLRQSEQMEWKFLCTDSPEEVFKEHFQQTSHSQSAFILYYDFMETLLSWTESCVWLPHKLLSELIILWIIRKSIMGFYDLYIIFL